jgi:FAD/FMN-containing dehydrogenase
VDPTTRTVRVEGGCVWAKVDHATRAFGMATPSGTVGSTGVGPRNTSTACTRSRLEELTSIS